jgi:hypothetical protein
MIVRLHSLVLLWAVALLGAAPPMPFIGTNDVVAWVGGSDVASATEGAHLASLVAMQFPQARFRNFGWEGDTVFAQPRDVGFPALVEHLANAKVSIVLLQFGRGETLNGNRSIVSFRAACEQMGTNLSARGMRVGWITPAPFERGPDPLPDLTAKNASLAEHVRAISSLCAERGWLLIDAFADLSGRSSSERLNNETIERRRLTTDGLQLSPPGHALFATAVMRRLGSTEVAARAGQPLPSGAWSNSTVEQVRQLAIEKDRLWVNYWRPHNWAFLGGDRTSQPSSRDHRDPKMRWFPDEMQRYLPMIAEKERQMRKAIEPE